MARDVQIRLGDGGAPQSYTVPNATEILPRSINATFDGTGASGSFVPTVEIVSDGGVVVARVPCQTTVAAGDSAECTFAPFLRAEAAATPAGGALSVAAMWTTITGTTTSIPPSTITEIPFDHFDTTAASVFTQSSASRVTVSTKGIYAAWASLTSTASGGAASGADLIALMPGGNRDPGGNNGQATRAFDALVFNSVNPFGVHCYQLDAGDDFFVQLQNVSSTVTYSVRHSSLVLALLAPTSF